MSIDATSIDHVRVPFNRVTIEFIDQVFYEGESTPEDATQFHIDLHCVAESNEHLGLGEQIVKISVSTKKDLERYYIPLHYPVRVYRAEDESACSMSTIEQVMRDFDKRDAEQR